MASELVAGRPSAFAIQAAHQESATLVRRLGDGDDAPTLWLSEGLSNSWLLATSEGRVVVNTGMGFEGPVHRAAFDAVSDGPVRYVVLTQGHVDHVGGVDRFVEAGTEIVAQAQNAACQADDARIHAFRVRRSMPYWLDAIRAADAFMRRDPGPSTQSTPTPTITFDDRLDLSIGGLRLELLSVSGGETVDSLCVWLPDHGVAIVGNLFSALFGHMPNLSTVRGDRYRFVEPFIDSLERVRALGPELLCTGHFAPIEGVDAIDVELVRIRDAVRHVHDETVRGMNAGRDVHTLMREIRLPEELSLGEGYGKVDWAVRSIWDSYAGWFHARSTTELYPVAVADVAGDLVGLAGGVGPVVARAVQRADEGDAVEAIHLAELAVAAEPDDRTAVTALLHAHRVLLAQVEGQNFWETGWLRTQIAALEARVAGLSGEGA